MLEQLLKSQSIKVEETFSYMVRVDNEDVFIKLEVVNGVPQPYEEVRTAQLWYFESATKLERGKHYRLMCRAIHKELAARRAKTTGFLRAFYSDMKKSSGQSAYGDTLHILWSDNGYTVGDYLKAAIKTIKSYIY